MASVTSLAPLPAGVYECQVESGINVIQPVNGRRVSWWGVELRFTPDAAGTATMELADCVNVTIDGAVWNFGPYTHERVNGGLIISGATKRLTFNGCTFLHTGADRPTIAEGDATWTRKAIRPRYPRSSGDNSAAPLIPGPMALHFIGCEAEHGDVFMVSQGVVQGVLIDGLATRDMGGVVKFDGEAISARDGELWPPTYTGHCMVKNCYVDGIPNGRIDSVTGDRLKYSQVFGAEQWCRYLTFRDNVVVRPFHPALKLVFKRSRGPIAQIIVDGLLVLDPQGTAVDLRLQPEPGISVRDVVLRNVRIENPAPGVAAATVRIENDTADCDLAFDLLNPCPAGDDLTTRGVVVTTHGRQWQDITIQVRSRKRLGAGGHYRGAPLRILGDPAEPAPPPLDVHLDVQGYDVAQDFAMEVRSGATAIIHSGAIHGAQIVANSGRIYVSPAVELGPGVVAHSQGDIVWDWTPDESGASIYATSIEPKARIRIHLPQSTDDKVP